MLVSIKFEFLTGILSKNRRARKQKFIYVDSNSSNIYQIEYYNEKDYHRNHYNLYIIVFSIIWCRDSYIIQEPKI